MKRLPLIALSSFLGLAALAEAVPALAPLRLAALLGSRVIDNFLAVRSFCPRPRRPAPPMPPSPP
jgi:hypothetical protein